MLLEKLEFSSSNYPPTYHTAALSTDNLAKEYFGDQGMLGYVANVQEKRN